MNIRTFLLLSFLRELADNVGGKTTYLWTQDFLGPSECWESDSPCRKQVPTGRPGLPDFRSKIWSFWHNSMKPVILFANSTTYWMAWVIWMAHCCHRASLDWSRGYRPWTDLFQGADEMRMPHPLSLPPKRGSQVFLCCFFFFLFCIMWIHCVQLSKYPIYQS